MKPAPRAKARGAIRGRALVHLLIGLLLVALLGLALWAGLEHLLATWGEVPLNITIDGEPVARGLQLGAIGEGTRLAIVVAVLVLLLSMALLLPVLLVAVIAAALVLVLITVAVAVGAPAIAAASVVAAIGVFVVAPIVLLARLLRRLLRGRRPRLPALPAPRDPSATIER